MKINYLRLARSLVAGVSLCFVNGLMAPSAPADTITAEEAGQHVGKTNTVCGTVADAKYLAESQSKMTFLNFGAPHPNQVFEVVIEDANRSKFTEPPETAYQGKKICVTGLIESYKDKPQIKVTDPKQISIQAAP